MGRNATVIQRVSARPPGTLPGASEMAALALNAVKNGIDSPEWQALELLGMTPTEALDRAQGRDIVSTVSTGRTRATRVDGVLAFGNQVAVFGKNSNRPIKVRPKQTEHGRLKAARLGLDDVRVSLAIWHSDRNQSWPPPRIKEDAIDQATPAQLFMIRNRLYLKFLRWDVRSAQQKDRILHAENLKQRAKHGGHFKVTELPPLDELFHVHQGLEEMLAKKPKYKQLYRVRR